MRKRISRIAGIVLCVGLLAGGLSGCGKSDEAILKSGISAMKEAKSYEMEGSYSGTMILTEGEEPATEVKLETKISEVFFQEPFRAKVTSKMTADSQTAAEVTTYVNSTGEQYDVYTNTYGTWSKVTLQDSVNAMAEAGLGTYMMQQFSDDMSRYVKKEDKVEGDNSYLVYEYTFSQEEVLQRMKEMLRSWGSNSLTGEAKVVTEEVAKSISDMKATLILDRKTKSLVRVEYPVSELVTKTIRSMLDAMASIQEEDVAESGEGEHVMSLQEALAQLKIEAKDMVLVVTYKNLDHATDFEIPKEVLEAESEVK